MTCEHCARSIERKLSNLDGDLASSIDYQKGKGEVTFLTLSEGIKLAAITFKSVAKLSCCGI